MNYIFLFFYGFFIGLKWIFYKGLLCSIIYKPFEFITKYFEPKTPSNNEHP